MPASAAATTRCDRTSIGMAMARKNGSSTNAGRTSVVSAEQHAGEREVAQPTACERPRQATMTRVTTQRRPDLGQDQRAEVRAAAGSSAVSRGQQPAVRGSRDARAPARTPAGRSPTKHEGLRDGDRELLPMPNTRVDDARRTRVARRANDLGNEPRRVRDSA